MMESTFLNFSAVHLVGGGGGGGGGGGHLPSDVC